MPALYMLGSPWCLHTAHSTQHVQQHGMQQQQQGLVGNPPGGGHACVLGGGGGEGIPLDVWLCSFKLLALHPPHLPPLPPPAPPLLQPRTPRPPHCYPRGKYGLLPHDLQVIHVRGRCMRSAWGAHCDRVQKDNHASCRGGGTLATTSTPMHDPLPSKNTRAPHFPPHGAHPVRLWRTKTCRHAMPASSTGSSASCAADSPAAPPLEGAAASAAAEATTDAALSPTRA